MRSSWIFFSPSPIDTRIAARTIMFLTVEVAALEARWSAAPDREWQRWQRDRALLQVAGKARVACRETAWSQVST